MLVSLFLLVGDYTGSNLVVNGIPYNTYCRPIRFNGCNLVHYNTPDLVGNKYSIIYYVCSLRKNKTDQFVDDVLDNEDDGEVEIDDDNNSCLFDED